MKSFLRFIDGEPLEPHGRMAVPVLQRAIRQALEVDDSYDLSEVDYTACIQNENFFVRIRIADVLDKTIKAEIVLDLPQGFFRALPEDTIV